MTCIRCHTAEALQQQGDLCAPCTVSTRLEVSAGLRRIADYLAAWAAFDDWLKSRGRRNALV